MALVFLVIFFSISSIFIFQFFKLQSTKIGFDEGLRNSVDVLVAQQVFFNARKDILESRYNYLMNLINLKLSVGILTMQDLDEINQYLITDSL